MLPVFLRYRWLEWASPLIQKEESNSGERDKCQTADMFSLHIIMTESDSEHLQCWVHLRAHGDQMVDMAL